MIIKVLIYIVSTILTYILGLLSKKFKWNQNLPIPVQNIFVGLIVFAIFYIIKKPIDTEIVIEQIILAMGGAGTATLGYDAQKIGEE